MKHPNETTSSNSSNEQKSRSITDKILGKIPKLEDGATDSPKEEKTYALVTNKIMDGKIVNQEDKQEFLMTIPVVKRAIFKNKVGAQRVDAMTLKELKKEAELFLENFEKVTHRVTKKEVIKELPTTTKMLSSVNSVLSRVEVEELDSIIAENKKVAVQEFTKGVENCKSSIDLPNKLRQGIVDFLYSNTNIDYSRNQGGKVEVEMGANYPASPKKITITVNPKADATILIAEMYALLVQDTKLLHEAKKNYIAYRYGLLGGMYNYALLYKQPVDAPEVVLKLLTMVNIHGVKKCLNRALEQSNNFVMFTRRYDANNFSKEQKWLLTEFFKAKSSSEQARILGLSIDQVRATSLDRGWHSSMDKLVDNKSLITLNEVAQLLSFNITTSIYKSLDQYALNKKVNTLLNYVISGNPEGNKAIESNFKYCIHPEILKVIMATKPYHNYVHSETIPAENREEFKEPDKMFSKISGAVNMTALSTVAKDAYKSLPKGEDAVYNRVVDPYLQKTLADKDKIPRLMFPCTQGLKQLKEVAPEGYFDPSIIINKETGEEYNPFAEYLKYVAGTPREDIANGLMAYPFDIWHEYLTLLRKYRGPLYRSKLDEEEGKELSLLEEVKLEEFSAQEEAFTHLLRGAVEYSIRTGISTAKGTNALLQQVPAEHNENMYKTARLILAMAWNEKICSIRKGHFTKASKRTGRIRIRDVASAHNLANRKEMSFSKSTNIRNIQEMYTIYWDVVASRWESKFPYMFYGVKTEALSIIGNHHDFAENALPSMVLSEWAYTSEDMSFDKFNNSMVSKNHNRHKGTTIVTSRLNDLKLFGVYLPNEAWRNWSFPLNTPAYARWFHKQVKSKIAFTHSILDNKQAFKTYNLMTSNMNENAAKSSDNKDVPYDDTRYNYHLTHPRYWSGEAMLASTTRTKVSAQNITKVIKTAKATRQRIRELLARKYELVVKKKHLTNSSAVEELAVVVEELRTIESELKICTDALQSKATRTTEEYKRVMRTKVDDFRSVATEVIMSSAIDPYKEIIRSNNIPYTLPLKSESKELAPIFSKLLSMTFEDPKHKNLKVDDFMTPAEIRGVEKVSGIILGNSYEEFRALHQVKMYKLLHIARNVTETLVDIFNLSKTVRMDVIKMYSLYEKFKNRDDKDLSRAYQLRIYRTKLSKAEVGQYLYTMLGEGYGKYKEELSDLGKLLKSEVIEAAEEKAMILKQKSPIVYLDDLKDFYDFINDCVTSTEIVLQEACKDKFLKLKDDALKIRGNQSLSEDRKDEELQKLFKENRTSLARFERYEHYVMRKDIREKKKATKFIDAEE